jgi:hypothetical protein
MTSTGVGTMVTIGALIGIYKVVKSGQKQYVVKIIFANVALFATLTVVGQFISWEMAAGLALIYLLNVVLNDGGDFITWFGKLAS